MSLMQVAWKIYFALPPAYRQTLRTFLKRGAGHGSSQFNGIIAERDALGKCRIDRTANMLCEGLEAAGLPGIESKRCLEIGTGYVGSIAVVMSLLGAKAVTTIDLNPLLVVSALKKAILSTNQDELIHLLARFVVSEDLLAQRVQTLFRWASDKDAHLPEIFAYRSPFDLLSDELDTEFDLIYSVSTLEHIPRSLVDRFLKRMASQLAHGGIELHAIDLADHFDRDEDPLGFLALKENEYSDDSQADSRGNRIRASEWITLFRHSGLTAEIVQSSRADPTLLPKNLVGPYKEMDRQDLLQTSILLRAFNT